MTLEEKITCGKIKSKAKTILVGNFKKSDVENINNDDDIIVPTICVDKIIFSHSDSNDFNLIISYLLNSTIIISNSPNPKDSIKHILVLPGYLCEINKLNNNKIQVEIKFKNFFPSNIPININTLYFMIWFKNILPTGLVNQIQILYKSENTLINKLSIINNKGEFSLPVQQTQTFNIICKDKTSDQVIKRTNFDNMCRAFWIKFNIIDYNNLQEFMIELNSHPRLCLTKNLIEIICEKKIISSNYIVVFVNLELGSKDWFLPNDLLNISRIYSNSCNMSRIDTIKIKMKFLNKYTSDNIQITSLSGNNLKFMSNNLLEWKYF